MKNKNICNKKQVYYVFTCFGLLFLLLIQGFFLLESLYAHSDSLENWVYIYGWIGIIIYLLILFSWKAYSDFLFSPYIIFVTFVFLFNYGQFILWALGIHYAGELGATNFIRYMDEFTLLKIEIISSASIVALHCGALLSTYKIKFHNNSYQKGNNVSEYVYYRYALRFVCVPLLITSAFAVIFDGYQQLGVALSQGYTAIYYGNDTEINPLLKYLTYMFFPSLIGILIANKFAKKSFYVLGVLFLIYMVVNLLAGDRGSWAYFLPTLYWCYYIYIKKFSLATLIKQICIFSLLLISTATLVKFREFGFDTITLEDFSKILDDLSFVFLKPFFEMGQSARVLGIIIQDQVDITWKFGNTYIAAILGMFVPRFKVFLGYPDFYLDNWISQTYLNLENYGIGFSIIAEAFLNGGLFFFWLIMLVLGICIGYILKCNKSQLNNPIHMFIVLSSIGPVSMLARGSFELNLRKWAYGTLIVLALVEIVKYFVLKKKR